MSIIIDSAFDSGNIIVLGQPAPGHFRLKVRVDAGGEFAQWFHFRIVGAKAQPLTLDLVGMEGSAYPQGWRNYQARFSTDHETWACAGTSYAPEEEGGRLRIQLTPEHDNVWIAYFAPYSHERHQKLIGWAGRQPGVRTEVLGQSIDGRAIDCLTLGEGGKKIWLYARQHPGETMAEWWMEGALDELTSPASEVGRLLRQKARFHIIPNMNPDGAFRGHLRTNAVGANLNREWAAPTKERSPEVLCVLERMLETGVDFALDVHGDEALPHNFIAGFEGIPSFDAKKLAILDRYKLRLTGHSRAFQTRVGYPVPEAGKANMTMSTNALAERFHCVAGTLEMPFKDSAESPEPAAGWSPERARRLGRACLQALADIIDDLG